MNTNKLIFCALISLTISGSAFCQENSKSISDFLKNELVTEIINKLDSNYVDISTTKQLTDFLAKKRNSYSNIPKKLASQITKDLLSISKDKHLVVTYDPKTYDQMINPKKQNETTNPWLIEEMNNYGLPEVKYLKGRIGYLNITTFFSGDEARNTAVAALNYLSNSEAIIIDVRNNGGGSSYTLKLILSYFFNADTILSASYWRPTNATTTTKAEIYLPGKRLIDIPLFILTSSRSFSAAEAFAQIIKDHKRGVIIGESTGGGSHSGNNIALKDGFYMYMSKGKPALPLTDWEGVGVIPDFEIAQELALPKAHKMALDSILSVKIAKGEDTKGTSWYLNGLNHNPIQLSKKSINQFVGKYRDITISSQGTTLYFKRDRRLKFKMTPIGENKFILIDDDYTKVEFIEKDKINFMNVETLVEKDFDIKKN